MRRFLINIFLFSALCCLLAAIGEICVRHIPNSYDIKRDYILRHGDEISTLILGNSHAYYGVKPGELGDSAFNLANVSQKPDNDLDLLREYIAYMPNLKRVIATVDYASFREIKFEDGRNWFKAIPYKRRLKLHRHSDFSIYNFEISNFRSYAGTLKNVVVQKPSNKCDSLGFGLNYTLARRNPRWKRTAADAMSHHTQARNDARAMEIEQCFDSMADICRAHGVELILTTPPVWKGYRALYDRAQLDEMRTYTKTVVERNHLRYFDMAADTAFTDNDFFDSDHLNSDGAAKFSRMLKQKLNAKQ